MFDHTPFMQRAIALARKGQGNVAPNPMVGAVFVKNGEIIGEGYHKQFGDRHAEVEGIINAQNRKQSLAGSTLYVTLEPCFHYGKQGPCTDELIKNKISKVFYADYDPNPKVNGRGIKALGSTGIPTTQLQTEESKKLNEIYIKNTLYELPFVHLKITGTLDGKITLKQREKTLLSNPASVKKIHELRAQYDAILIGVNTLLIDDPRLTARIKEGGNPVRIILDSHLRTPKTAQIFKEGGENIIATTINKTTNKFPDSTILTCKYNADGRVDLDDLLQKLFDHGIRSILVEGGATIARSFLKKEHVDRLSLSFVPILARNKNLPSLPNLKEFPNLKWKDPIVQTIKQDIWLETSPI